MFVWDVSSKLLDDRSCVGKCLLSIFLPPLVLIELAQDNTNAPLQRPQPLCLRSFLSSPQRRCCFLCPAKTRQGLAAQFPEERDDIRIRQVGGGRDQPIGNVQRQFRVTTSQSAFGMCSPDESLPNSLHWGIRFKRGRENRFGLFEVLLQEKHSGKES